MLFPIAARLSLLIESISSKLLFFMCNKNNKNNKNDKNDKNNKNAKNNRYICYYCDVGVDKGKELYFALDMVYCSKDCRYNYLKNHDYDMSDMSDINIVWFFYNILKRY